jgi:hypothetical protein
MRQWKMGVREGKGARHNLLCIFFSFFFLGRQYPDSVYGFCYHETIEWTAKDENRMVLVN